MVGARALSVLGDGVHLPWRRSAEARASLSEDAERSVRTFEHALTGAWRQDNPLVAFGRALEAVSPGDISVLYPGAIDAPPRWTIGTLFSGYRGEIVTKSKMPAWHRYGDLKSDPFANRPVALPELAAKAGTSWLAGVLEEVLIPTGFFHQLRTVMYDAKGRVVLHAGLYRPSRQAAYTLADHAKLFALQPLLRRWLVLAETLGFAPLGTSSLIAAIEALGVPAVVVRRGKILFGNALARSSMFDKKGAELSVVIAASPKIPVRTKHDGVDLVLLPHAGPSAHAGFAAASAHLPSYLAPVARLLRQGLSDKEISLQTAANLTTVRTYVQRVLKRLGLSDRRELMRLGD